jgi:hypothetical protein
MIRNMFKATQFYLVEYIAIWFSGYKEKGRDNFPTN